jgi:hypothetical protein
MPTRVGEDQLLLRAVGRLAVHLRLGQPGTGVVLAAGLARAEHVQAHPARNRGEPGPQVVDRRGVAAVQAQPGLLHGVVGIAQRAQHPVGERVQLRPVRLELAG